MQPQQILVVHVNSLSLLIEASSRIWCCSWQRHSDRVYCSAGTRSSGSVSEGIIYWNCVCAIEQVA